MSKKNQGSHSKTPRIEHLPASSKIPRAAYIPNDSGCPQFQFELDMDGPFGWDHFKIKELPDLLAKLFELQRCSWQELKDKGSHLVAIEKLEAPAQKRLRELKRDDLDNLYSLRLTGKKRVWGVKNNNILRILWWDPEHQVCLSNFKDN